MGNRYEEILHNLRTREDYLRAYHRLDTAKSKADRKRIRQETGINRASIWALLPYFDMGRAIPGGYMHAICINLMRALITLWRGEFKGLDPGSGNYIILAAIWETIGQETRDSNHWMPAAFVTMLPNIDTRPQEFHCGSPGILDDVHRTTCTEEPATRAILLPYAQTR
jgi:hypothetical protein